MDYNWKWQPFYGLVNLKVSMFCINSQKTRISCYICLNFLLNFIGFYINFHEMLFLFYRPLVGSIKLYQNFPYISSIYHFFYYVEKAVVSKCVHIQMWEVKVLYLILNHILVKMIQTIERWQFLSSQRPLSIPSSEQQQAAKCKVSNIKLYKKQEHIMPVWTRNETLFSKLCKIVLTSTD